MPVLCWNCGYECRDINDLHKHQEECLKEGREAVVRSSLLEKYVAMLEQFEEVIDAYAAIFKQFQDPNLRPGMEVTLKLTGNKEVDPVETCPECKMDITGLSFYRNRPGICPGCKKRINRPMPFVFRSVTGMIEQVTVASILLKLSECPLKEHCGIDFINIKFSEIDTVEVVINQRVEYDSEEGT